MYRVRLVMVIYNIADENAVCLLYMLEDIADTIMHVKSKPIKFKSPTFARCVQTKSKNTFCKQGAKRIRYYLT